MADSSRPTQFSPSRKAPIPSFDRHSATGQPWAVMRQKWRDLLFLHWAVDAQALRRLVPPQLELDLFDGTAYVGLVPFTMTGVRPVGIPPIKGLSSFHETNLRTYVRLGDRDPGVWFFNLEAASSIAVCLARALFHLPYHRARMFLEHLPSDNAGAGNSSSIVYAGVRLWPGPLPASYTIRATPRGLARTAAPGSLEHFLIERYILYAIGKTCLYQGRVSHTPYPIQSAEVHSIDETILNTWNIQKTDNAPLAHFSTGVDVRVFALHRVANLLP
jgi:uncharacterized protein